MATSVSIYTIPSNVSHRKPREPLVQLIAAGDGDVRSIAFHPDDAAKICKAISAAAKSSKAGRKRKTIEIELT